MKKTVQMPVFRAIVVYHLLSSLPESYSSKQKALTIRWLSEGDQRSFIF